MILLKLALKEIRNNLRFTLFFVFNLALGLSGLVAIDSLKISIRDALDSRAKGILAADLEVGARRDLTDEEQAQLMTLIPQGSQQSRLIESFTMIAGPSSSRLVEMKIIESEYPFYGEIQLTRAGSITSSTPKSIFSKPGIWAYPELLLQLGLNIGDSVRIGDAKLEILDTIIADSSGVGAGFSFAPPIYLSQESFARAALAQKGMTGYYSYLFKLPPGTDSESFANTVNKSLLDPAIRVKTPRNASEQVGRLLGYLGDYLGLSALVAIFLTALGQVYLYRSYLVKRYRDMAILKSIGLDSRRVFKLYVTHVVLLGVLALVPALAFALGLMPLLSGPARDLVNVDIAVQLHTSTLFLLLALSLIGSFFVCGPLIWRAVQIRPLGLLQPALSFAGTQGIRTVWLYAPAIISYYGVSLWLAKSVKTGSLFFATFAASVIFLALTGAILLRLLARVSAAKPTSLSSLSPARRLALFFAVRNLHRDRFATLAAFMTLGLGVLLSNLIPVLESGIRDEIRAPSRLEQPSLFLVDIQDDQIRPLLDLLATENIQVMQSAPMIRARLMAVNDQPFEKSERSDGDQTREEENENRFRNRGFNITYRESLSPSERILAGTPFAPPELRAQRAKPEISLETRFADRLGLKIGDQLTFDIQGIPVDGEVTSIRKVRWTSFQPNFFIQFSTGSLEDAPKTHLVTLGPLSTDLKTDIQNKIVKTFSNVSILDVSRLIERLTGIISQMSLALKAMAVFAMVVGLLILFSIASHQVFERRREVNLLKILGGEFQLIRRIFTLEFTAVAVTASIFGTALALAVGFVLSQQLFDSAFALYLGDPLLIFVSTFAAALVITWIVVRGVLKSRPLELLQSAN